MMLARILIRTIKTKERTQAPISAIPIIHQVSLRSRNAHSPNCWKLRKLLSLYTAVFLSHVPPLNGIIGWDRDHRIIR